MNNLFTFRTKPEKHDFFHAEATPDGVHIMTRSNDGIYEHVALITYEDAVNRLDEGRYDDNPDEGYAVHLAIASGGNRGWFGFTAQHNLIMWRWLIAAAFIAEMRRENGTITVTESDGTPSQVAVYSGGKGGMSVYPFSERLAMANHIEGSMTGHYGAEKGTENAIMFYSAMLDLESGRLTPLGRETLAELHDYIIADLNENGIPEMPVTH